MIRISVAEDQRDPKCHTESVFESLPSPKNPETKFSLLC